MNKSYLINKDFVDTRLDKWLKTSVCNVPQSLIEKSIRKGKIKVNDKRKKSSYKLQINDRVNLYNINFIKKVQKEKFIYKIQKSDLKKINTIFIENNSNFVVINKPSGIAVQSGTKSRKNIIDMLRYTSEFKDASPFTVHRIDKETTGILIVAKNRKYAQLFTSLFRIRKIHKTYLCVVLGLLDKKKGILKDDLIYFDGRKKIKTTAITAYKVLDSNNNYSLLSLNPETGRKHQLRRQLLIHGHPIFGDTKYRISANRDIKVNNLMLHAYKVSFSINNEKYIFTAKLPIPFEKFLKEKYLKIYQ